MERIILMGIKHSGKSTLGKLLTEKLSADFYDTDNIIEEMTGFSPREIFNRDGENAFKKAEAAACKYVFEKIAGNESKNAVIATGGGVCNNEEALSILEKNGKFVFLEVEEEVAFGRIVKKIKFNENDEIEDFSGVPAFIKKNNPRTRDDVKASFHNFYVNRTEIYKKLCKISVRLDKSLPQENVEKVLVAATAV